MLKNLKNTEFSKRLLYFVEFIIIFICALTAVSVFMGMYEPLTTLITGVFALASIAYGFYYWKAKNENIRKYAKGIDKETLDKLEILLDKYFES